MNVLIRRFKTACENVAYNHTDIFMINGFSLIKEQ